MYIKIPRSQLYPNNHHDKQILHSTFLAIQQTTNHKNTTCFQPKVLHNVDKSVWFYTSLESWVRKRAAVQIRRCWVIWPSKKSYLEPVSLNAKWFRCRASIHSLEGAGSFMECNSWLLAGRRLGVHEAHHCPFKNPLLTPGYFVWGGGQPLKFPWYLLDFDVLCIVFRGSSHDIFSVPVWLGEDISSTASCLQVFLQFRKSTSNVNLQPVVCEWLVMVVYYSRHIPKWISPS